MTTQSEQAAQRAEYNRRQKEVQDSSDVAGMDKKFQEDRKSGALGEEVKKAYEDQVNGVEGTNIITAPDATTYRGRGAADVGGYVGAGADIKKDALSHEKDNDIAQALNAGALGRSTAAITADRGTVHAENGALLAREAGTRNAQLGALGLDRQAAEGNAPSAADYKTQLAMNDAMGGQAGAMGSARGLAGLSGTQAMGAQGLAGTASAAALSGGMARSAEMADNLSGYGSRAAGVVGGDLARVGQSNQNASFNADTNDAWKLGNANLAAKQAALATGYNQMDDSWYDQGAEAASKQLEYDAQSNAMDNGANQMQAQANAAASQAERDRSKALAGGVVAGTMTAVGSFGGPLGTAAGAGAGGMMNSAIQKW
jgi:hypothetical protein